MGVCMLKVCIQITCGTQATQSWEIQIYQITQKPLALVKIEHQWHNGYEFTTVYDSFISTKLLSL